MYTKKNGRMTYKSNRRPNFKRNNNYNNAKGRNKGNVTQQYNKYLKLAKDTFSAGDDLVMVDANNDIVFYEMQTSEITGVGIGLGGGYNAVTKWSDTGNISGGYIGNSDLFNNSPMPGNDISPWQPDFYWYSNTNGVSVAWAGLSLPLGQTRIYGYSNDPSASFFINGVEYKFEGPEQAIGSELRVLEMNPNFSSECYLS